MWWLNLAFAADPCADASARLQTLVCVHAVPDARTWKTLYVGSNIHWTRYLVPARPEARLPALIVNANQFQLHQQLLAVGFEPLFPGLDGPGYARLVLNPQRREFYGGNVIEHPKDGSFGFTLEEVGSGPVSAADIQKVQPQLQAIFGLGSLRFEPSEAQAARGLASSLSIPTGTYEVYSQASAFGVVRRVRADAIPEDLSRDDVLLLDAAPFDLDAPVAAAVTSVRTGELSHLSVRSAARGTPACFLADAWDQLAVWEGKRVQVSCDADTLRIRPASAEEAAAWNAQRRPAPLRIESIDPDFSALVDLRALPTADPAARLLGLRRFGSKGRNLAVLTQRIPDEWSVQGFLIPMKYYLDFMKQNWEGLSFAETLQRWYADPAFLTDPAVRRSRLKRLREAMEAAGIPDPEFEAGLAQKITQTFGARTMVRFRSSSNAEDNLLFSAAGLYESTSVCLADDEDADTTGPSQCDPETDKERGIQRGLKKVWASLWTDRAVEERLWYGIDPTQVGMAILVDPRAAKEQANIVAFSGSPNGQPNQPSPFLVEAQAGEGEVVSADPGVWPELSRIWMDEGAASRIERAVTASGGVPVLTDTQLRTLAMRLDRILEVFPVDERPGPGQDLVLDTEWKILEDGRLIIKQVRPFLRSGT